VRVHILEVRDTFKVYNTASFVFKTIERHRLCRRTLSGIPALDSQAFFLQLLPQVSPSENTFTVGRLHLHTLDFSKLKKGER
jgi:hypothetical protein